MTTKEQDPGLTALDAAIATSVADADAGRIKSAEEVFARLSAKYRAMTRPDQEADSLAPPTQLTNDSGP